jgi:hypothetical protein
MPYERYSMVETYVTPAFPGGHRATKKTPHQIEHDSAVYAEREHLDVVVHTLTALTGVEGWDCYTDQLAIIETQLMEELVQTPGGSDYLRGYIMGLRKAVHLPAELAQRRQTQ